MKGRSRRGAGWSERLRAGAWRHDALVVVLVVVASASGLLAGEVILRGLERWGRGEMATPWKVLPDPELGSRAAPNTNGLDANGFRNARVPETAEIVAIGDSQTWGVNAHRGEAWPQRLAALTGKTVYNMSWGGYGTLHYRVLSREALRLSPKVVVIGLYLGNDLYESYRLAYQSASHTPMRAPCDEDLRVDTIEPRASALWKDHLAFQQRFGRESPHTWGLWLRGHTAVGRLLERAGLWSGARGEAWFEIGKAWADANPGKGRAYLHGRTRTVMTTAYRWLAVDLSEVRIREGLRITKESLGAIRDLTSSAGARLLVVLIPTKERVYGEAVRGEGPLEDTYAGLVQNEEQAAREVSAFCEAGGIAYLDVLPAWRAALGRDEAIYPPTTESHPNPKGYLILAKSVAETLERNGW